MRLKFFHFNYCYNKKYFFTISRMRRRSILGIVSSTYQLILLEILYHILLMITNMIYCIKEFKSVPINILPGNICWYIKVKIISYYEKIK